MPKCKVKILVLDYLILKIVIGLISRGSHVFQEITENQLYSILFMKRRNTNARGTPVRAAIQWVLLEEARLAVSACLNQENYSEIRVLRDQIKRFIGDKIQFDTG